MVHSDQAQLALTEVEQTNTPPVLDPFIYQDDIRATSIDMICKFNFLFVTKII